MKEIKKKEEGMDIKSESVVELYLGLLPENKRNN